MPGPRLDVPGGRAAHAAEAQWWRGMTPKEYLGEAARLSCAICRRRGLVSWPVELHHPRTGTGAAMRASDYDVIPLCVRHHRLADGIHGKGTKAWIREFKVTEAELVEETRARVRINLSLDVSRWGQEVPEFLAGTESPQIWPLVQPLSGPAAGSTGASSPTPTASTTPC